VHQNRYIKWMLNEMGLQYLSILRCLEEIVEVLLFTIFLVLGDGGLQSKVIDNQFQYRLCTISLMVKYRNVLLLQNSPLLLWLNYLHLYKLMYYASVAHSAPKNILLTLIENHTAWRISFLVSWKLSALPFSVLVLFVR
jgi:hypothetical protein